eukprot:100520-Rhodomonas_salina.2
MCIRDRNEWYGSRIAALVLTRGTGRAERLFEEINYNTEANNALRFKQLYGDIDRLVQTLPTNSPYGMSHMSGTYRRVSLGNAWYCPSGTALWPRLYRSGTDAVVLRDGPQVVPDVYRDFSGRRVLTMEWIEGITLPYCPTY